MSNDLRVDCVMPAAGLSFRMGDWKMMLPYRHHTILDESIENALSFCTRVILVAGYRSEEIVHKYRNNNSVDVVVNDNFEQGMFGSIQQGVAKVESDYFFISHGDMPCISTDIYRRLWSMRGKHTLFPGTVNLTGHPVLLPSSLKKRIMDASLNSSMKKIIRTGEVKYAGINDSNIHLDVDTPEAYKELCVTSKSRYQNES